MTQSSMIQRGALYVAAAVLTTAQGSLEELHRDASPYSIIKFSVNLTLSAVIAWRSYIDKSPADAAISATAAKLSTTIAPDHAAALVGAALISFALFK